MIPKTVKALLIIVYISNAKSQSEQLTNEETNDFLEENTLDHNGCSSSISIYNEMIADMQNVIIQTLVQAHETFVTYKQPEKQPIWIVIKLCVMEILSNQIDKAVSIFNSIDDESSISMIIEELYIYNDLKLFEVIVRFINKLEIKLTKINGFVKLYEILIENDDFNIVNGMMLFNSVLLNGKDDTQYFQKRLMEQLKKLNLVKDVELFVKFTENFENNLLVLDMMPTFVNIMYPKESKNFQFVVEQLQKLYFLNQKLYGIIALTKEISLHKANVENSALNVVNYIIQLMTLLANQQCLAKSQSFLEMIEESLPANFSPLLNNDLCFMNKHYGQYLYVDSDDNVRDNLYRPILTRKTVNPSPMFVLNMKFGIRFQCIKYNCTDIFIENLMQPQAELLFAENGTIHTYKGKFPDAMEKQAVWRLESDGEYFQLKNQEYGTFLQMDKTIEGNGYEIALKDMALDWDSDKTKWKIERCNQLFSNDHCEK